MNQIIKVQTKKIKIAICWVFAVIFSAFSGRLDAAELIMFRSPACEWCEAWDTEIGQIYHKTEEGKALPLRKIDIEDPLPESLNWIKAVVFTPTFVAIENRREIGRIIGYPGEAFFWGYLSKIVEKVPKTD